MYLYGIVPHLWKGYVGLYVSIHCKQSLAIFPFQAVDWGRENRQPVFTVYQKSIFWKKNLDSKTSSESSVSTNT
jgi:hypothetical protein